MKVKELKKWAEYQPMENIVKFYAFDPGSEAYTKLIDIGRLDTRPPKRCEFQHKFCKCFQVVDINGKSKFYCNRHDVILKDQWSCDYFEHKTYDLQYLGED